MSSFAVLPLVASATAESTQALAQTVLSAIRPYTDNGDTVRRVAQCQAHYGVVLLQSGTAVLLAPAVPGLHGVVLNRYCTTCRADMEGGQADGIERVVDVAAGASHVVLCTATGAVWSFGYDNRYGQLGDGTMWPTPPGSRLFRPHVNAATGRASGSVAECPPLSLPRQLDGFATDGATVEGSAAEAPAASRRIAAVACGATHTLLLTEKGNCVYACGRGHRGQLGTGRAVAVQATPRAIRLLFGLNVACVVAAAEHSFVLLRSGKLFAFGDNVCGQLGLGHTSHVLSPTVVPVREGDGTGASVSRPPQPQPREDTAWVSKKTYTCDAKARGSLRAPYASPESMYYPLRVRRLDEQLGEDEAAVVQVWAGATMTVLRTRRGQWLSCGLAPSHSVRPASKPRCPAVGAAIHVREAHYDGYGVLGRPLRTRREAYYFGLMRCTARVQTLLHKLQHGDDDDDNVESALILSKDDGGSSKLKETSERAGRSVVNCLCYPQLAILVLRQPQLGRTTLVMHSSLPYTTLCHLKADGETAVEDELTGVVDDEDVPRPGAKRLLLRLPQDNEDADAVPHCTDDHAADGAAADDAVELRLDATNNMLPLQDSVVVW